MLRCFTRLLHSTSWAHALAAVKKTVRSSLPCPHPTPMLPWRVLVAPDMFLYDKEALAWRLQGYSCTPAGLICCAADLLHAHCVLYCMQLLYSIRPPRLWHTWGPQPLRLLCYCCTVPCGFCVDMAYQVMLRAAPFTAASRRVRYERGHRAAPNLVLQSCSCFIGWPCGPFAWQRRHASSSASLTLHGPLLAAASASVF